MLDLHFKEVEQAQAKLVSYLYEAIVNLRMEETFGYAYEEVLSLENQKQKQFLF